MHIQISDFILELSDSLSGFFSTGNQEIVDVLRDVSWGAEGADAEDAAAAARVAVGAHLRFFTSRFELSDDFDELG